MLKKIACISLTNALITPTLLFAHGNASLPIPGEREIQFPDTAEHMTLVVDLHTHSVFSDGHVWPRIRVGEAIRDGLDAMAVTEHLEWQPHIEDIPHPDRNRSYHETMASIPEGEDLMIIPGSEITRRAPHGHMNAVFISDANLLFSIDEDQAPFNSQTHYDNAREWPAENAVDAANDQGAFVFWNHSWSDFDNAKTVITDFHREAAASGKLHGIEIANGSTYSPESFQIALDHGLTPVGVSDVHNLVDWDYEPHNGGHRPVNLVFTEERSITAIRESLIAGRTVVWYRNLLIGLEDHIMPLIKASLSLTSARYLSDSSGVMEVTFTNTSDANYHLELQSDMTPITSHNVLEVAPHSTQSFRLRTDNRPVSGKLEFSVLNALTAPDSNPEIAFDFRAQ